MATGTLAPYPKLQFFDDDGDPLAGGLLYTYAAGTSTPLATYSDVALATPNANPVVLDAAGRATVFLSATSYKFVLKTSAGATIWTADNISAVPSTTIASSFNNVADGRITLTSGTPVTSADVTGATTLYYSPYAGNRIALFDGSAWNLLTFSELSLALAADAANTNWDLFAYSSSGVVTLERVAWTNATTRATGIALQDGVYVKSGDATRRYLGTYRTTGTIGQTEDSFAKRFVWNYANRVKRPMRVVEATDSWTYTLAAFRQANASAANQLACVVGVAEVAADVRVFGRTSNTNANINTAVGIGYDSTTTATVGSLMQDSTVPIGANGFPRAELLHFPAVGYHFYAWLEFSAATGTTTWYGDAAAAFIQSGIHGTIDG